MTVSFVDMGDHDAVRAAITGETKALWIETPLQPADERPRRPRGWWRSPGKRDLFTVCDNTFLSPALQRPIEMGVDVEVHSTTKYINGHSDVIAGAVVTGSEEYAAGVAFVCNACGLGGSPFDCWLTLRGVKTLGVRMKKHEENAAKVARFLHEHPAVERVFYPGLPHHPGHELAKEQQLGFGAMLSFETAGDAAFARQTLTGTRIVQLAESLGGIRIALAVPVS